MPDDLLPVHIFQNRGNFPSKLVMLTAFRNYSVVFTTMARMISSQTELATLTPLLEEHAPNHRKRRKQVRGKASKPRQFPFLP